MKSSDVVRALAPADQAGEDEPLSALMYPLRFLGMGLLIAWLCCTHVASIFPGDVFDPALRSAFDTGMRIGDIGTFLAFVLFAPRIGRLSRHKAFSWAAVALTTASTAAVGLALIPGGVGEAVIIPASIVTAIGGAVLFCLWAEAYSQMGATRTLMYGALSCIAAAAASFLISTMEAPFGVIATALLPLASLACAHLSFRLLPTERAVAKGVHYPIPWKLIVIMAIAGLLSSFSGAFLSATEYVGAIHRVAATGIVGVVILVMAVSKRDRFDARSWRRWDCRLPSSHSPSSPSSPPCRATSCRCSCGSLTYRSRSSCCSCWRTSLPLRDSQPAAVRHRARVKRGCAAGRHPGATRPVADRPAGGSDDARGVRLGRHRLGAGVRGHLDEREVRERRLGRVGPVAGRPAARAGTARALHEPLRRPGRAVRPDRP